jgi:hypothetical protein
MMMRRKIMIVYKCSFNQESKVGEILVLENCPIPINISILKTYIIREECLTKIGVVSTKTFKVWRL